MLTAEFDCCVYRFQPYVRKTTFCSLEPCFRRLIFGSFIILLLAKPPMSTPLVGSASSHGEIEQQHAPEAKWQAGLSESAVGHGGRPLSELAFFAFTSWQNQV